MSASVFACGGRYGDGVLDVVHGEGVLGLRSVWRSSGVRAESVRGWALPSADAQARGVCSALHKLCCGAPSGDGLVGSTGSRRAGNPARVNL